MLPNFSEISKKYEKDSVVQKSASEILFDLLEIQPKDDVLDLGCGPGHISRLIRDKTSSGNETSKIDILPYLSACYKNEKLKG